MSKQKLRQKIIQYIQSLSLKNREEIEERLFSNLLSQEIWKKADVIGITISQHIEWDTKAIIEAAWEQGKKVCVPKCVPSEKKLNFYQLESYDQLEVVYYDLQEPDPNQTIYIDKTTIDLLVVPGLLFDYNGYRIGFGGGFYDRFLVDFPHETVSIFSSAQLKETIPVDKHDIPVQHLITESDKIK